MGGRGGGVCRMFSQNMQSEREIEYFNKRPIVRAIIRFVFVFLTAKHLTHLVHVCINCLVCFFLSRLLPEFTCIFFFCPFVQNCRR